VGTYVIQGAAAMESHPMSALVGQGLLAGWPPATDLTHESEVDSTTQPLLPFSAIYDNVDLEPAFLADNPN
jgi:hypothetical protein